MKTTLKVSLNFKQSGLIKSFSAEIGRNVIFGRHVTDDDVSVDVIFDRISIIFVRTFSTMSIIFWREISWENRLSFPSSTETSVEN